MGKRLSTCPQILVTQKAFLQTSMSYDLMSVIKLLGFCLVFCLQMIFLPLHTFQSVKPMINMAALS